MLQGERAAEKHIAVIVICRVAISVVSVTSMALPCLLSADLRLQELLLGRF